MIKIFKLVRQKLLSENKFSKYLVYAFGEIILVVIGILIAVQINNWNAARKDRAYEVTMLTEIKKGLEGDQINLQEQIEAYTVLKHTSDYFTSQTQSMGTYQDSMQSELWKLNIGRYFQFNTGPYEALKSSGIDRVSTDSLRNHLIHFFDFELIRFKTQIDHTTRRYRDNVEQLLSLREDPFIDQQNNWIVNRIPNDLFQKPAFIWLLSDIHWRASNAKNTIETFTPKIEAMIDHISLEIDK